MDEYHWSCEINKARVFIAVLGELVRTHQRTERFALFACRGFWRAEREARGYHLTLDDWPPR